MDRKDLNLTAHGITENRYRELMYYCRQYPEWKKQLRAGENRRQEKATDAHHNILQQQCEQIEKAAEEANPELSQYLIRHVTEKQCNVTYLKTKLNMPCGARQFYESRRRFFMKLHEKKQS